MTDGILRTRDELNSFTTSCYGIVLSTRYTNVSSFFLVTSWGNQTRRSRSFVHYLGFQTKSFYQHPKRQGGPSNTGDSACRHLILVADGSFAVDWVVEDGLEAHHSKKVRERKHLIARVPLLLPSPYLREISFPNPASTSLLSNERNIIALNSLRPVVKTFERTATL